MTLAVSVAPERFEGTDSEECEEFIFALKKHIFEQGKDQDDAWVARYASTLMAGHALRWYEELEDDVQGSWKRLKQALLKDFPSAKPSEPSPIVSVSARCGFELHTFILAHYLLLFTAQITVQLLVQIPPRPCHLRRPCRPCHPCHPRPVRAVFGLSHLSRLYPLQESISRRIEQVF